MAADIDQPGGKLKRTFAAAVAAVTASTSMSLTATMAAHQGHRKDKTGKYAIALLCDDKHNQPDSVDVKTVRIYKVLGAFQQPDQPALPS
jgi:hypothetical protein